MMEEPSEIQSFYRGKTIFITGGSGLMGKVLIEKLLYSCSDLKKIYMLLRPKRGRAPETRLDDIFKLPVSNYYLLITIIIVITMSFTPISFAFRGPILLRISDIFRKKSG